MRGGATLRSDSTDESIYQLIKDLEKKIADYHDRTAELEAKLETHQADLMGALKGKLTEDIISEIASEVIENQDFDNGVASLVQNAIENNHPPEDLLAEAVSLPIPTYNETINGTFVEMETPPNQGETTGNLVSGDWCIVSFGAFFWGTKWEIRKPFPGWKDGCHRCPVDSDGNKWEVQDSAFVQSTFNDNGSPLMFYWYKCV